MQNSGRTTVLCILDGFGLSAIPEGNAVSLATKPNIDKLLANCPNATLVTHGERVGLPPGHMGNSEVGHLNIGAGRVVRQWLAQIPDELKPGGILERSPVFLNFLSNVKNDNPIHLIGLFSNGGVHSDFPQCFQLVEGLERHGVNEIKLHIITDGRDTGPQDAINQIEILDKFLKDHPNCEVASISGRFYAMDRDKRWERTERAYRVIAEGVGPRTDSVAEWIQRSYARGITDEFIEPAVVRHSSSKKSINNAIFWNFRADRMRQLVSCVTQKQFEHFKRSEVPNASENYLTFTNYDPNFNLPFLFESKPIENHLGQVVSLAGLRQLRTAETEKYPHVTYFFNGGIESALTNEDRSMVPSPREVRTYDLKPEMSAFQVNQVVLDAISSSKYDLIVVNFANCDMVGHTGVLAAAIKAVETVDNCIENILSSLTQTNGQMLIIADHGNCEQMVNYEDGTPHTAHTTNPVPIILFGRSDIKSLATDGALCDVAPTILDLMDLKQPIQMSGRSLLLKR